MTLKTPAEHSAIKTSTALKEWASVILALATGQQSVLYRKGGIIEKNGDFEIEAREFYLFPTFLHQDASRLKPDYAHLIEDAQCYRPSSTTHRIALLARITEIARPESLEDAFAKTHQSIWNAAHIEQTWLWKPEKPLYILTLEVEPVDPPIDVEEKPEYGGCVSWITLDPTDSP